jgi:hypothetical protein
VIVPGAPGEPRQFQLIVTAKDAQATCKITSDPAGRYAVDHVPEGEVGFTIKATGFTDATVNLSEGQAEAPDVALLPAPAGIKANEDGWGD